MNSLGDKYLNGGKGRGESRRKNEKEKEEEGKVSRAMVRWRSI